MLASSEAQAQIVFRETFGTVNAQLPTATSTADGNWVSAACLNGQIIAGGSPSDTTGSTHRLFHNTAACSYTAGEAAWRTVSAIPVQPNTSYAFSYWTTRLNTAGDPVLTQAVTANAGGSVTITNTSSPGFPAAGAWVQRFVRFTTDASTTSVDLRINNANTSSNGNDFSLDDIVLEQPPGPPTLTCSTTAAVFNTAYDGGPGTSTRAVGQLDLNWDVGIGPALGGGGPGTIATWTPAWIIGHAASAWATSPFGNANWIGHTSNGQHAGFVDLYFRYRFTIDSAVDPSTFGLRMDFYTDNSVQEIYVNGVPQSGNLPGVVPQSPADPYNFFGFSTTGRASTTLTWNWQTGANELVVHVASFQTHAGFLAQMIAGGLCQIGDWGDAPASYATTVATNGASHTVAGPYLGAAPPDEDFGGTPTATANGDDAAGDDEEGVVIPVLARGATPQIQVTVGNATAATRLQAWIDWDRDGTFAQAGEQVLIDAPVVNGANTFSVSVPVTAVGSTTFARFRIADVSGLSFNGSAASGEVEDHQVTIITANDWGDAPATYATSAASNGPSHLVTGPYLGAAPPDAEANGVPSVGASGDDSVGDDEDGVVIPVLTKDVLAQIQVTVGNATPATRLQAWIDWNGNGTFAESGEQVLIDQPVVNGVNTFTVPLPALVIGTSYARFRIADQSGLSFTGPALSGEVEDYQVTLQVVANVSITKTDNSATYSPGTTVNYTIVVTNAGPSGVSGNAMRLTDTRPAGTTATTPGWTCSGTGGANCHNPLGAIVTSGSGNISTFPSPTTYLDIPPNQSITVTFGVVVPSTFTGNLVNTATITPPPSWDPDLSDNSATDTDTVAPADLSIAKVSTPNPYVPGSPFSYTIVATNLGPGNAPGATIADTLPAALAGLNATWTCTFAGGAAFNGASTCPSTGATAINAQVNMPAGGSMTIVVSGMLPQGVAGVVSNAATIAPPSNVPDPVMGNNSATDVNPAGARADLRISKASTPNPFVPGETLTYTIIASNAGPSDAIGALVQDTLPAAFAGFTWTCAAAGTGAACPATGMGDINTIVDLPSGTSVAFTITGTVPSGYNGVATNTATIAPPPNVLDPVPGNNTSTTPNPPGPIADLRITKAQSPDPYTAGAPITYTLLVDNLGPSDVTNARVQDTLPGVVTGASWSCVASGTGASCAVPNGVNIVDTLVSLPVGTSATFTITGTVSSNATGLLTNTATVAPPANITDPVPGNNESTVTSGGAPVADLQIAKTATPNPYVPGALVTFTIVARNNGPSDALNARVQDLFPAALSSFTWTCATTTGAASCGTTSGTSLIDSLVDLPAGSVVTFTVSGTVPPDTTGPLTNTATIAAPIDVRAPDLNNNQSAVTLGPGPIADLKVTKTSTPNPYLPGSPIIYTLTYSNAGPSSVFGAQVQDQMPPVLANVAWMCTATNGTCSAASGTGNINATVDIGATGVVTFTITADVPAGTTGPLVNSATIVPPPGIVDPAPTDNAAIDSNPVVAPGGPADLQITQVAPSVAPPNGLLTFQLVVRNLGSHPALNPYTTGMIPPGTTFVSATPSAGGIVSPPGNPAAPDPATGYPIAGAAAVAPLKVTWPGLMNPGDTHTLEFTVRVAPSTPTGQILWSCWWTWSQTEDPYHANNVVDAYLFVHDGVTPVGDLALQGATLTEGVIAAERPARVGEAVPIRFWATNHGPAAARGQYALILDTTNTIEIVSVNVKQGWISPSGPSSAVWETGPVAPGQTVAVDLTVRLRTTTSVKLFAQRIAGAPGDPNATNEHAEIVLDGYGPAGTAGRWVAVGNVDGAGAGEIVTGAGQGETPQVRIFTGTGSDTGARFFAYERPFLGGVRIASCDVDGDGTAEVITAPGPGRAPTIRVLRVTGGVVTELTAFDAFEAGFLGGVYIACADLDADGSAELVVGAGPGRAPDVKVYNVGLSSITERATFLAYESSFRGGVRVAAGAYAGRPGWLGAFAIATTPGPGRPVELRLWEEGGAPVAQVGISGAKNGVLPTLGDANGDGQLDLVVAPDDGRPELVRIFNVDTGDVIGDVPGGGAAFPVGVRIALGVLTGGPGASEIVVGNGPGGHPRVRVVFWPPAGPVQRLEILPLEIP